MANIDIFNLEPAGTELFTDSENFLADLNEEESGNVAGGFNDFTIRAEFFDIQNINATFGNSNGNQINIGFGNRNVA